MKDASKTLQILADRFDLSDEQTRKIAVLANSSVSLEISGTAITSAEEALHLHIADSLSGVELQRVREASSIADIGAGVGFPGLVLAVALPDAEITLIDGVRKKMEAAGRLAREIELENVDCVWARVEEFAGVGSPARESFDIVAARALAPLTALLEYAAPLLKIGGSLVAWKGDPDAIEQADANAAEAELGFKPGELTPANPFKGSRRRHFYVAEKAMATTDRYPRRPGAALRKPITA